MLDEEEMDKELDKMLSHKDKKLKDIMDEKIETKKDVYWEWRIELLKNMWENPQVNDFQKWSEITSFIIDLHHDKKISSDVVNKYKNKQKDVITVFNNAQKDLFDFYKKQYDKLIVLEI